MSQVGPILETHTGSLEWVEPRCWWGKGSVTGGKKLGVPGAADLWIRSRANRFGNKLYS